jgi:hypothetical protein
MLKALLRLTAYGLLCFQTAVAVAGGATFSAEAVTNDLQNNRSMTSKIFIGDDGLQRKELIYGNETVVEISNPVQGLFWQLLPSQSTYYEHQAPAQTPPAPGDRNPCSTIPELKCSLLGKEPVHGRTAEKWEIQGADPQGQTFRVLRWMDLERNLPLKEQTPDGTTTEMRLLGNEKVAGRTTEKWEMKVSRQQKVFRSYQWYDPQLEYAIREEMPGKLVRELRNIKVGPQPAHLFQVPPDYQKLQPPKQNAQPPQG